MSVLSPQIADAELEFSFEIGSFGTSNDELKNPKDVIVSSNGKTIYVVDTDNHRINVFDDDGDHDFKFGSFCNMASIQDCNDNADGADDDGDGQFNKPTSAVLDSFGNLFVVDSGNERIQRFDDGDGEFELKFGSSDDTKSEYLGSAQGIATLKSTREIYVSSSDTDSISVFSSSGNFLFSFDSFDGNDDFRNPSNMIIDDTKEILYVSDTDNHRILIFQLVDDNTCPSNTDEVIDGVCFVEKFGSSGSGDGKFDSPTGLALDTTNDLLYVADTDNDRIQVFTLTMESASLIPSSPTNLNTSPISPTSIILSWDEPVISGDIKSITGYKIEYKTGSDSYSTIIEDTRNLSRSFIHEGLASNETYFYRVSAINSEGISTPSSSSSVSPEHTKVPAGLTATAIAPSQIRLNWHPPSDTFGQSIGGYEIKRVITNDVYDVVGQTNGKTTSYIVSNLATDKMYTYVVVAKLGFGFTDVSNTASTTPRTDSVDSPSTTSSTLSVISVPSSPIKLTATSVSSTQINLDWDVPPTDGNSPIIGYKIEVKKDAGSYSTLVEDTKSVTTAYSHTDLKTNSKYTYKVSAINLAGISTASNEITATPAAQNVQISPLGKITIDEGKILSFTVRLTDNSLAGVVYSLEKNPPAGAKINPNTGMFTWTPTESQGPKSYVFDIVAKKDSMVDRQSITITVNDILSKSEPNEEPKQPQEPTKKQPEPVQELEIALFVDPAKDPQTYVDRYNNEASYKKWFDNNYSEYSSIYEAVGLEPAVKERQFGICGPGTKLIDGVCTIIEIPKAKPWWQFW